MPGPRWISQDELAERREEWSTLSAACDFPSAFSDPRWVSQWWKHYGEAHEPWSLALEDDSGSLRGLALLALDSSSVARTLTFTGGRWNGLDTLLFAPGAEDELAAALLAALAERQSEWDLWRIARAPIGSSLADALLGGRADVHAAAHDVRLQPYVELPAEIDVFESRFGGKRRTEFRRRWRRLQEAGAEMQLVSDPDQAPAAMARLLNLRRERAAAMGQNQSQMDERFDRFITDVVREMLPHGVRLWLLEMDGQLLTGKLNLVASWREHGYISAVSAEQLSLSPGHSLERQAIHAMIDERRAEFDIGPGRDDYKYHWGATDREVARMVIASPTARGRLFGARAAFDLRLRNTAAAEALRRRKGIIPERATAEHPARKGPELAKAEPTAAADGGASAQR
ncbi:MAG: GNAT family N-acetyltransferase [Solirubrobacteraceae bacterium]